ncbi:trichothecene 3-O-acetyltransferase [Pleurotus eryngii]|uniref:Trichothecene 3-O-acetyltransferase n=1 Tax=Pleurotus eryngii TaxID=5323 RepID=A0A9P5ZW82_PLEER|nr:trichothecene 3-O-acetyltransferase [Pleurotus eryngii]
MDSDQPQSLVLDVFGQSPSLQIYTQLCFCFALPDHDREFSDTDAVVVGTLSEALQRLTTSFPWLAGQVVNENSGAGDTGVFMVKPSDEPPRLVVRDLRKNSSADPKDTRDRSGASVPTMASLRRARFPFTLLDETLIAPRNTVPGTYGESDISVSPVFLVQATFIEGGLILTFVAQHATMDMIGQGHIIRLFDKACRKEDFTAEELAAGNVARQNIVPLLDDSFEPGAEVAHQIVAEKPIPDTASVTAPPSPPPSFWAYFMFNPTELAALKSLAIKTLPSSSSFVSTDDALTAFVWQSIARARLPRLSPTTTLTLGRAIDPRSYLDIPSTYPGVVQNMTYHRYTARQLAGAPLGHVAAHLRSALGSSNFRFQTQALATLLARAKDKNSVSVSATLDLSTDIMLSSWAKVDCCRLDFGLGLGMAEAVRRPRFVPVESLGYLMPKGRDGGIAVGVCLRDEDMERLKGDEEFRKRAVYVG